MSDAKTAAANRLREIRGERSMADMAKVAKVTRQTWFKWEQGGHLPRDLDGLATKLGVTVADLFEQVA